MAGIAVAFYLARPGLFSSIADTFAVGLVASATSHAVISGLRLARGDKVIAAVAASVVVAGGALAFIVVHGASAPRPRVTAPRNVDEVMRAPDDALDGELRLHGYLEPGTLMLRAPSTYRFVLAQHEARVDVELTGAVPDTLKERAEIIATGHLTRLPDGAYRFVASAVIAKCPDTYQTATGPQPASRFR